MWGKLIFNLTDGVIDGWIVDSWTGVQTSAAEHLPPEMHRWEER